jgi:hypothetical protein
MENILHCDRETKAETSAVLHSRGVIGLKTNFGPLWAGSLNQVEWGKTTTKILEVCFHR